MTGNEELPRLFDADARAFLFPDDALVGSSAPSVAFATAEFRVQIRDREASITGVEEGLCVDHLPVRDGAALAHRSLIVTPKRRAYVFLLRDDPGLSTPEDAQQWILAMLQRRAGELQTNEIDPSGAPFPVLPDSLPLRRGRNVIGRDQGEASIVLPGIQVSRMHAAIDWDGPGAARIADLVSFNGTFVNGDRVRRPVPLELGDRIDIGPVALIYAGDRLTVQSTGDSIEVVLRNVSYQIGEGGAGGPKTLLDGVSLAIRPREFVVIVGPSGSGKSLLIKAMGGRLNPSAGAVYVNRSNLAIQFESLKRLIGYVPQRDVLHDALRLGRALDYSARLRLPSDVSPSDRTNLLDSVVTSMELTQQIGTRIASLSGGQTRRASLANQMLSRPGLLLLDEVTSGLDEKTDGELMRLFRRLADKEDKTVVCVTHNLNYVAETAHHIVVLARDGKLAYFGTPEAVMRYFGVTRLGQIYEIIESGTPQEWKRRYEESADHERFVRGRLPVLLAAPVSSRPRRRRSVVRSVLSFAEEWRLLSARAMAVKLAQPRWLGLLGIQCVGLALLIGWLFGDLSKVALSPDEVASLNKAPGVMTGVPTEQVLPNLPSEAQAPVARMQENSKQRWRDQKQGTMTLRLLVALAMCALWLGCNNASAEIVRERSIFESEREIGLGVWSYLTSKLAFLGGASLAQILILLALVRSLTHVEGSLGPQFAMLAAVGLVGVLLGLAISAWSRTSEISTVLVPIVVIPQILLAGTMVPLEGVKTRLAELFIPLHWGYRGLVHQITFKPETSQMLRLVGALPEYPPTDGQTAWWMLAVHGLVLALVCYFGLRFSDPSELISRFNWRKFSHH